MESNIITLAFHSACLLTEINDFLLNFLFAPLSALPACGCGAHAGLFHRRRPRPLDGQQGGPFLQRPSQGSGGARVWLRDRVRVMCPHGARVRLHLQHQRHRRQQRVQRLPQRRHADESR